MYQTVTIAELRMQYEMENALKPASLLARLFGDDDDDVLDHMPDAPPFQCAIALSPRGNRHCIHQCPSCIKLYSYQPYIPLSAVRVVPQSPNGKSWYLDQL